MDDGSPGSLPDTKKPLLCNHQCEVVSLNSTGEVTQHQEVTAKVYTEILGQDLSLNMVLIPGGTYQMGSRLGYGYDDEHPQHRVSIPSFLMSKYPITQEQWSAVMDWIPPYRCTGARRPVDRVSWREAVQFCKRLSKLTGREYRLSSEAEWEFACRARTTTPFYFGNTITTDVANYVGEHLYALEPKGIYRHVTTDVASFLPNSFGLFDTHGNVWEWCADTWHDNYVGAPVDCSVWEGKERSHRVLRGGCWHDPPDLCRSAARLKAVSRDGEDYFGFRVALTSLDQISGSTFERLTQSYAQRIRSWFQRSNFITNR